MPSNKGLKNLSSYIGRDISKLLVLSLIESKDEQSGYSIIKKVKKFTNQSIVLRAGSIYPLIGKLTSEGVILKKIKDVNHHSDDIIRQKAVYSLTAEGYEVLDLMKSEWERVKQLIDNLLNDLKWDKDEKHYEIV